MGYETERTGMIRIEPPLKHFEFRDSPIFKNFDRRDARLVKQT